MQLRRWIKSKGIFAALVAGLLLGLVPRAAHAGDAWQDLESKLMAYNRLMQNDEAEIKELIEQKNKMHDSAQIKEIMSQIATKYQDLQNTSVDYENVRTEVRFDHPERNDKMDHSYTRYKLRSLKSMEDEFGIDGRLDRAKSKVLAIFPVPEAKKPELMKIFSEIRKPASEQVDDVDVERVNLVK